MKTTLFAAALAASSMLAHAESVRVRIPAGYTANGVALPAGEYTVTPLKGNPSVLLLDDGKRRLLSFGRVSQTAPEGKITVDLPKSAPPSPSALAALKVTSAAR
jgi:hypothetical protein